MKPLLALVDCQCDFLEAPGIEPCATAIVERAAALCQACRTHRVPVAHVWTTVSREDDHRMPHWKRLDRWRCVAGTPGHLPPPPLSPSHDERTFHKTGFSAFGAPGFAELLRNERIDLLIIAGVYTHACVRQTAIDAHQLGLRVLIVEDAVASDDPMHAATTQRYLELRDVRFRPVAAIIDMLRAGAEQDANEYVQCLAIDGAAGFADEWRRSAAGDCAAILRQLADAIDASRQDLAVLTAATVHKPIRFARVEIERASHMLRAVVQRTLDGENDASAAVAVRRRPHGLVAVITPWNNPIYIALGKIAPAVACGNVVAWKPAPEANAISRELMRMMAEAGWPRDMVTLIEGDREVAVRLMHDARVSAVTLTGSSLAGFAAQDACANRRIPLQAELGGNNAAIVWPDADLRLAAAEIAAGAFDMAGQRCTANRRVIVHESLREDFLDHLMQATAALPWGDPLDPRTRIGPLVSAAHRDRVAACIRRAAADEHAVFEPQGATPPTGSDPAHPWFAPTIIRCDDANHEIVQEETFGPALVVQTASDWPQAIRLCNGVRQGLAAALFSNDESLVARFLDQARAGILKINRSTADADVDVPFGGWKASGIGPPEHGESDIEFFTRPQTVYRAPAHSSAAVATVPRHA